jgi:radical SAM-linked protein
MSVIEGAIARGDRRLGFVIEKAHSFGCKLDGWSEHFRYDLWEKAFRESGLSIDFYTTRQREISEKLPWDHIDSRVDREFLKRELALSMQGKLTPDCRISGCHGCGVCDNREIKNNPYYQPGSPFTFLKKGIYRPFYQTNRDSKVFRRFRIQFSKVQEARFLSHLELYSVILRALRRAEVPLRFSLGHHPLPKVTFGPALPLGIESHAEFMEFEISGFPVEKEMFARINRELPNGISIINFQQIPLNAPSLFQSVKGFKYLIELNGIGKRLSETEIEEKVKAFMEMKEVVISRITPEIKKKINVRSFVEDLEVIDSRTLKLSLRFDQNGSVRPTEVIKKVFDLDDLHVRFLRILKTSVSF